MSEKSEIYDYGYSDELEEFFLRGVDDRILLADEHSAMEFFLRGVDDRILLADEHSAIAITGILNTLASERDAAVRVAGELRAKAAIADQIFASGYMDWYTEEGTQNNVECRFCGDAGLTSEFIVHADHCPKVAYDDSLTASTGGSSDEPQKEIRE